MNQTYNNQIEFRSIVLEHIKKILDLSTHELRNQTIELIKEHHTQLVINEDTRISYVQSVENLAYVLLPYFDDRITDTYKRCILIMTAHGHEVRKHLKKSYNLLKQDGKADIDKSFVINARLKYAKKLFCELNLLLHRCDYLKSAMYGEDKSEIIEDTEGELIE
jgi:hypothetical protein